MRSSPYKPRITIALIYCLLAVSQVSAAGNGPAEAAATDVIAEHKTADVAVQVRAWQRQITHPSGNSKFKEFQTARLKEFESTEFAPHQLHDPSLSAQVREVLLPVLRLYDRQDCFEIIVVDSSVPVMMNDSAVLLMVTTGLLERAANDDELLGHVAHELGHDIYWWRTAIAREVIARHAINGTPDVPEAMRARAELARIEMECDAFSAVTLTALGRNPVPFARYLEATARDFSDYLDPDLPPVSLRAKVITEVTPAAARCAAPQTSEAFRKLKAMLVTQKNGK